MYGKLRVFPYVNELVSAQADGCRTGRIYHCSLHTGVHTLYVFDEYQLSFAYRQVLDTDLELACFEK